MSGIKIGFIGAGNIVRAIITGILGGGELAPSEIAVYDISPDQTQPYGDAGHPVFASIPELVRSCPVVVLAVKPQVFGEILPLVRQGISPDTLLVSVAAGITVQRIREGIGFDCKLILCIPNTPLELGMGATALARVEPATRQEFDFVRGLFASCGIVEELPHDKMREVIPVSSSSPAFVYRMAKVIVQEAAGMGIEEGAALRLFCQTLTGSARLLLEGGSPQELINKVCSPGGTTEAALKKMDENGFDESLRLAMRVCVDRAREFTSGGNTSAG